MGRLKRAYYSVCFDSYCANKTAGEFQNFFADMMEKCHPSDYIRVCPWGKAGDLKNDGYLQSSKTIFQVFAPNVPNAGKTTSKMEEDLSGAAREWNGYFLCWTFVTNSREMNAIVLHKLRELQEKYQGTIVVNYWGKNELKSRVMMLSDTQLDELLGYAPDEVDIEEVGIEEIQDVINAIARMKSLSDPIKPVPKEKIAYNSLSEDIEIMLSAGMRKEALVSEYFDKCADPKLGDEIASRFNKKYKELKSNGLDSNEIFTKLHEFAGGKMRKGAKYEAAVYAVLAHFFAYCDIFENVPQGITT